MIYVGPPQWEVPPFINVGWSSGCNMGLKRMPALANVGPRARAASLHTTTLSYHPGEVVSPPSVLRHRPDVAPEDAAQWMLPAHGNPNDKRACEGPVLRSNVYLPEPSFSFTEGDCCPSYPISALPDKLINHFLEASEKFFITCPKYQKIPYTAHN